MSSIKVEGMRCGHCSSAVKGAMEEAGAQNVQIDLESGLVSWEGDCSLEQAKNIIDGQGFVAHM